LNYNKLINEKLICAFRWSVLPSFNTEFFIFLLKSRLIWAEHITRMWHMKMSTKLS